MMGLGIIVNRVFSKGIIFNEVGGRETAVGKIEQSISLSPLNLDEK